MRRGLTTTAIILSSLATASCTKPNPDACTSNADCNPGQVCNTDLNICESDDVDAAPAGSCAAASSQCVPAPPDDWEGPFAVFDAPSGNEPTTCPTAYPDIEADLGGDYTATGTCDCECDPATGATCATAASPRVENAAILGGLCTRQAPDPNRPRVNFPLEPTCLGTGELDTSAPVQYLDPGITSGSCSPVTLDTFEASFGRSTRLCTGAEVVSEGCPDNELCAPRVGADDAILCIARDGIHPCPENSAFSRRLLRYGDDRDQRQCDCECDAPSGSCGSLGLIVDCDTNILVTAPLRAGGCYDPAPGDLSYEGLLFTPAPSGTCDATKTEDGTAEPVEPRTICCLP